MTAVKFQDLTRALANERPSYVLAELNDLLTAAPAAEIGSLPEPSIGDPYLAAYVAAMEELAANRLGRLPPEWTDRVPALREPVFRRALHEPAHSSAIKLADSVSSAEHLYRFFDQRPGMSLSRKRIATLFKALNEDVRFLLRLLQIEDVAKVEEIERYPARARYLLEEFLAH